MSFTPKLAALSAGVLLAVSAVLAAAPAQASPVLSTSAAQQTASPDSTDWLPYDGAHITTYSNCIARMNWLKAQYPPTDQWRCDQFEQPQCPQPIIYWMVMTRETAAALRSTTAVYSRPAAPAC